MDELIERIRQVRLQVEEAIARTARNPDEVTLVAVSKTVPAEHIALAYQMGLKVFGENRVQEARSKISALPYPLIRWHLIGHLQTNKVARAVELFHLIESVDSLRLAEALEQNAAARQKRVPVLLQVNVAGESTKEGVSVVDLPALAMAVLRLPHLQVQGLMTIAPYTTEPEAVRPVFRRLRELRDELRERLPQSDWAALSMGMSSDFPVAIEEGATLVRIGRAIFGERP